VISRATDDKTASILNKVQRRVAHLSRLSAKATRVRSASKNARAGKGEGGEGKARGRCVAGKIIGGRGRKGEKKKKHRGGE